MTITQISRCYWCGKTMPKDQMDAQAKKCKTECERYGDTEHAERLNKEYLAERKAASEARHEKWDREYLEAVLALPEWMPDDATEFFKKAGITEFSRHVLNRDEVLEASRAGAHSQSVGILGYFTENDPTLAPVARCSPQDPELLKIDAFLRGIGQPTPEEYRESIAEEIDEGDPYDSGETRHDALVETLLDYAGETQHGNMHVKRWNQALTAIGHDTGEAAMSLQEATACYNRYNKKRWGPVVERIKEMQKPAQPQVSAAQAEVTVPNEIADAIKSGDWAAVEAYARSMKK